MTDQADAPKKFDQDKPRWDLMPFAALEAVARVMTSGARKYGARNWEGGYAWGRLFGAAMRHMTRWWLGEDLDRETGESHLAHAACCILFLLSFWTWKVGEDDREKATAPAQPDPQPLAEAAAPEAWLRPVSQTWEWHCPECGMACSVQNTGTEAPLSICCMVVAVRREP